MSQPSNQNPEILSTQLFGALKGSLKKVEKNMVIKKHENNRFFFEFLTEEEKKILMLNFASEYAKQLFGENFMTILEIDQNIEDVNLLDNITILINNSGSKFH